MPDNHHPDDAGSNEDFAASIPADDPLARLLQDVRAIADQPAPAPTAALAQVLQSGFSNHLGPLVTAPSHPAGRRLAVRRRPKEKHHPSMTSTRFFRGLTGKVVVVGTTLLIGVSTAAAAGALPGAAQHAVAVAIHSVTPVQLPDASGSASANAGVAHLGTATASTGASINSLATAGATASTGATGGVNGATGAASAGANLGAAGVSASGAAHAAPGAGAGATVGAGAGVTGTAAGALSTLTTATTEVTACLTRVIGSASGQPLTAIGSVLPTLLACVQNVLSALPVPPVVTSCVSSLINSLGALPVIGAGSGTVILNGCVPLDLSSCLQALLGSVGGLAGSGATSITGAITSCANTVVAGIINLVKGVLGQAGGTVSGAIHSTGAGAGVSAGASATRHVKH